MSDEKVIGLDLDGVVIDAVPSLNLAMSELTASHIKPAAEWNWYKAYPGGEEAFASLFTPEHRQVWQAMRPVQGALRGVKFLHHRYRLMFITRREASDLGEVTAEWLSRHGLGDIPIHHSPTKTELPCTVHVDDKPSTVAAFLDSGRDALLFRQPWNHDAWKQLPGVHGWPNLLLRLCWGGGRILEGGKAAS